jgi:hypothetical protein
MREVEFKVSIALSRKGGNKGFRRDEKKTKLTVSSEGHIRCFLNHGRAWLVAYA